VLPPIIPPPVTPPESCCASAALLVVINRTAARQTKRGKLKDMTFSPVIKPEKSGDPAVFGIIDKNEVRGNVCAGFSFRFCGVV
jgi:hypothetical protein